jgi:hypothetical protein
MCVTPVRQDNDREDMSSRMRMTKNEDATLWLTLLIIAGAVLQMKINREAGKLGVASLELALLRVTAGSIVHGIVMSN